MKNFFFVLFFLLCNLIVPAKSENIQQIKIVHINRIIERAPTIYSINPEIKNNGILGSRMGIKDNNTTGKFTNQNFELIEQIKIPDSINISQHVGAPSGMVGYIGFYPMYED